MVVTITSQNAEQEIAQSTLPVIIKVHASWCGPCQQMTPIFEEVAKELQGKYKFAQLNVDDARDLSIKYGSFHFGSTISELLYDNLNISLTKTEGTIMHCLMKNPDKVTSYAELAETIWGDHYPDSKAAIKVYVARLRKKLEGLSLNEIIIINKPGVGYILSKRIKSTS